MCSSDLGLGSQGGECALDVHEVGGAPADVGAVVGHVGEELAAVGGEAQRLLVCIQDGDVATVAGQGAKHAGTYRRHHPERGEGWGEERG